MYQTNTVKNNYFDYDNKIIPLPFPQSKSSNKKKLQKATPSDYMHSLQDIYRFQNYFLDRNNYRELAIFNLGITTGLRISDIVYLRIKDILEPDMKTFKPYISLHEMKTGKPTTSTEDDVLITELAKDTLSLYFESVGQNWSRDDFVFRSQKPVQKGRTKKDKKGNVIQITCPGDYVISPEKVSEHFKSAAEQIGLPYHVSSHVMKKTFLNIAATLVEYSNIKISSTSITVAQILARHEDIRTTMRYLCKTKRNMIALRNEVSNFLLGRTGVDILEEDIIFDYSKT